MKSKFLFGVFAVLVLCSLSEASFSEEPHRNFSFRLEPNEKSKVWDFSVSFSGSPPNRFVGREFAPIASSKGTEVRVIKEVLSPGNYQVSVGLFRLASDSEQTSVSGGLDVTIFVGTEIEETTPKRPRVVGWEGVLVWSGDGDGGRTTPVSGRYLSYQIYSADDNKILDEQVVPVYLKGFRIPLNHWQFDQEKSYTIFVRLSNRSAHYSKPHVFQLSLPKRPSSLPSAQ